MFGKKKSKPIRHENKDGNQLFQKNNDLSIDAVKDLISNMDDGELIEQLLFSSEH